MEKRRGNGRSRTGFRLHTLELYNWGTFNEQVWRIEPGGDTALLTGENGSGKSTLVDALLTLLVPNQKRNYNQVASHGRQSLPARITIETEQDYLRLLGKVKEFERWQTAVALTLTARS